jgi:pyridoxine kinase
MQVRQTTESTGENLSYLKYETYNLPTAIVSNTLDYGKFDILDTTQYMKNTLGVWKALDFQFDAISTGFIVSKRTDADDHGFLQRECR